MIENGVVYLPVNITIAIACLSKSNRPGAKSVLTFCMYDDYTLSEVWLMRYPGSKSDQDLMKIILYKWEFPWFAAWDLAFHTIPLATINPDFAKRQLDRITREWYMHPNGQIPAYEWHFSDVNPPVEAWLPGACIPLNNKYTDEAIAPFSRKSFKNYCSILPGG